MKLKLNAEGHAVLSDGKPVYVKDDGSEVAFDAAGTVATISRLNGEAKSHRERAESAEGKLKAYEGIDDAEAAKKALETVKTIDQKKLVDAGQIETVKAEISKSYEAKLKDAESREKALSDNLHKAVIGGSFSGSKLIAEKFAIPADLVEARFGKNFSLKDGKIVATDNSGNQIFSDARPGELADFDEALDKLVGAYPFKDQILKGSGAQGGGAKPPGGSSANPPKGNMGGNRSDREAAISSRFPELQKG